MLYAGACCFVLSNGVYQIWCPRIIRDHRSFQSFHDDRKTMDHLIEYRDLDFPKSDTFDSAWEKLQFDQDHTEQVDAKFWELFGESNILCPVPRHLSAAMLLLGKLCLLVVGVEGFISVVRLLT